MFPLRKDHKLHLSILFSQPPEVLQDFCRLALDYLKKGTNTKLYSTASHKLGVTVEEIQLAVEALIYLMIESRRHSIEFKEFQELVIAVGFNEEQEPILSEFHRSTYDDIDLSMNILSPTLPHYHDLEWRFDVQVASRALQSQITPNLTMKLTLEDKHTTGNVCQTSVLLQTDPNNLKHIVEKLDQALQEASSQHMRRVQRALK